MEIVLNLFHSVYKKGKDMITLGNYVRTILEKKGLKQQDVVNRINDLGLMGNNAVFTRHKMSAILNGAEPFSKLNCGRFEKALDLPEGSLKKFINC